MSLDYPMPKNRSYKVLVDADLLMEFLHNRSPFAEDFEFLLRQLLKGSSHVNPYITSRTFNYIEAGHEDSDVAQETAEFFRVCFEQNILQVDEYVLSQARDSKFPDFESAVEHICAQVYSFDAIVTHDPANYPEASIPIWSVFNLKERLVLENSYTNPSLKTKLHELHPLSNIAIAVVEIIKQDSGIYIFAQYTHYLRLLNVQAKYDAAFVMNEAYLRACKALDAGKEITNYSAWLRATGFYIARELSRSGKK
jgi:hypothetical protein